MIWPARGPACARRGARWSVRFRPSAMRQPQAGDRWRASRHRESRRPLRASASPHRRSACGVRAGPSLLRVQAFRNRGGISVCVGADPEFVGPKLDRGETHVFLILRPLARTIAGRGRPLRAAGAIPEVDSPSLAGTTRTAAPAAAANDAVAAGSRAAAASFPSDGSTIEATACTNGDSLLAAPPLPHAKRAEFRSNLLMVAQKPLPETRTARGGGTSAVLVARSRCTRARSRHQACALRLTGPSTPAVPVLP